MTVEIEPCDHCGFPVLGSAARCTNCGKRRASTTSDTIRFIITVIAIAAAAKFAYENRGHIADLIASLKKEAPVTSLSFTNLRSDLADPQAAVRAIRDWARGDFKDVGASDKMGASYASELEQGGVMYLPAELQSITFTDDNTLDGLGRADRKAITFKGSMRRNGKTFAVTGTLTLRSDIEPPIPFEVRLSSIAEQKRNRRR